MFKRGQPLAVIPLYRRVSKLSFDHSSYFFAEVLAEMSVEVPVEASAVVSAEVPVEASVEWFLVLQALFFEAS